MQPLELLMPAGSQSKMRLALDYGADAVYLGPPLYSLRARDNDFASDVLKESIEQVHARGKKVYMTLNIFSRNRKIQPFSRDITEYAKMKPDAFIISDPGLNETRIVRATVNAIVTAGAILSIRKTGSCRRVNKIIRTGSISPSQNSTGRPSPRFTSCSVCCVRWWARSLPWRSSSSSIPLS